VPPEATFCPECGTSIPTEPPQAELEPQPDVSGESAPAPETTTEATNVCPNCGTELVPDAVFCPECGQRLGDVASGASETDAHDEGAQSEPQDASETRKPW
jgi:hypothetical protein